MSGLPRSMENHIHPFSVNVNALWLVHEGVDVFCTLYLLGFQIHDMKQTVVRWITVRKESIIPHHIRYINKLGIFFRYKITAFAILYHLTKLPCQIFIPVSILVTSSTSESFR